MTKTIALVRPIFRIPDILQLVMISSYSQQHIHEYFIINRKCININFFKTLNLSHHMFYLKKITGTTTKLEEEERGGGKNVYSSQIKKKKIQLGLFLQAILYISPHSVNSTTSRDLHQINVCLTCIFYLCNSDNYKHLSDTYKGERKNEWWILQGSCHK